jgi:hypothetical protein
MRQLRRAPAKKRLERTDIREACDVPWQVLHSGRTPLDKVRNCLFADAWTTIAACAESLVL